MHRMTSDRGSVRSRRSDRAQRRKWRSSPSISALPMRSTVINVSWHPAQRTTNRRFTTLVERQATSHRAGRSVEASRSHRYSFLQSFGAPSNPPGLATLSSFQNPAAYRYSNPL